MLLRSQFIASRCHAPARNLDDRLYETKLIH